MSDVALTAAQRNSLLTLQRTSDLSARTQGRLSSGRKVSSVVDDAIAFFSSKALSDRASDFAERKNNIDQGISAIRATLEGTTAVDSLLKQLIGIAEAAKTQNAVERTTSTTQFKSVLAQINELVEDSSYQGLNLLNSTTSKLEVSFGVRTSSRLEAKGFDLNATSSNNARALFAGIEVEIGADSTQAAKTVTADAVAVSARTTAETNRIVGAVDSTAIGEEQKLSITIDGTTEEFKYNTVSTSDSVTTISTALKKQFDANASDKMKDNVSVSVASSGVAQVDKIVVTRGTAGGTDDGDVFRITVDGNSFDYTTTSSETNDANLASKLVSELNSSTNANAAAIRTALGIGADGGGSIKIDPDDDNAILITGKTDGTTFTAAAAQRSQGTAEQKTVTFARNTGDVGDVFSLTIDGTTFTYTTQSGTADGTTEQLRDTFVNQLSNSTNANAAAIRTALGIGTLNAGSIAASGTDEIVITGKADGTSFTAAVSYSNDSTPAGTPGTITVANTRAGQTSTDDSTVTRSAETTAVKAGHLVVTTLDAADSVASSAVKFSQAGINRTTENTAGVGTATRQKQVFSIEDSTIEKGDTFTLFDLKGNSFTYEATGLETGNTGVVTEFVNALKAAPDTNERAQGLKDQLGKNTDHIKANGNKIELTGSGVGSISEFFLEARNAGEGTQSIVKDADTLQTTGSLAKAQETEITLTRGSSNGDNVGDQFRITVAGNNFDYTTTAEDTDSVKLAANLVAKFNQEVANGDNSNNAVTIKNAIGAIAVDSVKTDTIRITGKGDGTALTIAADQSSKGTAKEVELTIVRGTAGAGQAVSVTVAGKTFNYTTVDADNTGTNDGSAQALRNKLVDQLNNSTDDDAKAIREALGFSTLGGGSITASGTDKILIKGKADGTDFTATGTNAATGGGSIANSTKTTGVSSDLDSSAIANTTQTAAEAVLDKKTFVINADNAKGDVFEMDIAVGNGGSQKVSVTTAAGDDSNAVATKLKQAIESNAALSDVDVSVSEGRIALTGPLDGQALTIVNNTKDAAKSVYDSVGNAAMSNLAAGFAGTGFSEVTDSDKAERIGALVGALNTARSSLRAFTAELGGNVAILNTRLDFTNNYINELQQGSDKLTLADLNEEGANLSALQTRQQLGIQSLSIAGQQQQAILTLIR